MIMLDFIDFPRCWGSKMLFGVSRRGHAIQRKVCETGRDLKTRWPIVPHKFQLFEANLVFPQAALCCRGPGGLVSCRSFSPQHPGKSMDQARGDLMK